MAKPIKISIKSEFSAQRRSHPPNPSLKLALEFARQARPGMRRLGRVADLGCGKLRHYDLLAQVSDELYLIDTHEQLSSTHVDAGQRYSVRDIAAKELERGKKTYALTSEEFANSKLKLNLIFCVAVLDVVEARTRSRIIASAARNLGPSGLFIVIVPRNDSSILDRCSPENSYQDGHVFFHHGLHTFYRNFRDYSPITRIATKAGLSLKEDLSCYRQVCLVFSAK